MKRKEILDSAIECVCETRDQQYGDVSVNFARISKLWNAYLEDDITTAHDVAIMMALLKIGRIASGQVKDDNYIAKTYDRINYVVPKGYKNEIKAAADKAGQSTNAYITQAVQERMKKESR